MLKDNETFGVFEVVVEPHIAAALALDSRQRRLARLGRPAAQFCAVEQVECAQERSRFVIVSAKDVEPGEPAHLGAHDFAVDQVEAHLQVVRGFDYNAEPGTPVIAPAGD